MNLTDQLDQPTIDENIKRANEILDDMEFDDPFEGGVIKVEINDFDDVTALVLGVIINDTELDDRLIKVLSDNIKDQIPGQVFEPLVGTVLIKLGKELQKSEK